MTKSSTLSLQLILALFIAGAGYAIGRFTATPKVEVLSDSATKTVTIKDAESLNALAKARSEIDALKAEKQRLEEELNPDAEDGIAEPQVVDVEVAEPARRRQSWRDRMEELREKDPERYAEEMERRANFAKMMDQARSERVNFLDSIDTSLLSAEAQNVHERFITAIARQGQLQNEMMATLDAGEEPSEELRNQMQEVFQEINETREMERSSLLDAIAISMGLEEKDVDDFTTLVNEVFNATNGRMMGGPRGAMRGGRGPRDSGNMPPPPAM
jgi:hypothetical protein